MEQPNQRMGMATNILKVLTENREPVPIEDLAARVEVNRAELLQCLHVLSNMVAMDLVIDKGKVKTVQLK